MRLCKSWRRRLNFSGKLSRALSKHWIWANQAKYSDGSSSISVTIGVSIMNSSSSMKYSALLTLIRTGRFLTKICRRPSVQFSILLPTSTSARIKSTKLWWTCAKCQTAASFQSATNRYASCMASKTRWNPWPFWAKYNPSLAQNGTNFWKPSMLKQMRFKMSTLMEYRLILVTSTDSSNQRSMTIGWQIMKKMCCSKLLEPSQR